MSNEQILTEITEAEENLNSLRREMRALADGKFGLKPGEAAAKIETISHQLFTQVSLRLSSLRGTFTTRVDLENHLRERV